MSSEALLTNIVSRMCCMAEAKRRAAYEAVKGPDSVDMAKVLEKLSEDADPQTKNTFQSLLEKAKAAEKGSLTLSLKKAETELRLTLKRSGTSGDAPNKKVKRTTITQHRVNFPDITDTADFKLVEKAILKGVECKRFPEDPEIDITIGNTASLMIIYTEEASRNTSTMKAISATNRARNSSDSELNAIHEAMLSVPPSTGIFLITDSAESVKLLTAPNPPIPANGTQARATWNAVHRHQGRVIIGWAAGHQNLSGNFLADKLATMARYRAYYTLKQLTDNQLAALAANPPQQMHISVPRLAQVSLFAGPASFILGCTFTLHAGWGTINGVLESCDLSRVVADAAVGDEDGVGGPSGTAKEEKDDDAEAGSEEGEIREYDNPLDDPEFWYPSEDDCEDEDDDEEEYDGENSDDSENADSEKGEGDYKDGREGTQDDEKEKEEDRTKNDGVVEGGGEAPETAASSTAEEQTGAAPEAAVPATAEEQSEWGRTCDLMVSNPDETNEPLKPPSGTKNLISIPGERKKPNPLPQKIYLFEFFSFSTKAF
ncbi:hypothetical protein HK104_001898 [Borealophlyctis nickersoniae]|nr:hypothetical protein HK104_001898 [Borealophlyctis nickersoniae]